MQPVHTRARRRSTRPATGCRRFFSLLPYPVPVYQNLVPMDHFIAFVLSEAESRRFCARHPVIGSLTLPPSSAKPGFCPSLSFLFFRRTVLHRKSMLANALFSRKTTGWAYMALGPVWRRIRTSNEAGPCFSTFPNARPAGRSRVAVWISSRCSNSRVNLPACLSCLADHAEGGQTAREDPLESA